MKQTNLKKPTKLKIWSLLRSEKSLDGLKKRATAEVAQYIEEIEVEFKREYQKWFDVAFLIYSRAIVINSDTEREEYISEFACSDVVRELLAGNDYTDLIWKKLKPSKIKQPI